MIELDDDRMLNEVLTLTDEVKGTYVPDCCKTCEHKGFTNVWDDERMFLCMYREWSPRHWLHLLLGGKCSKYRRNMRLPRHTPTPRDLHRPHNHD